MRRLQRQISSVVIAVLLFAALATSFSLLVFLPERQPSNDLIVINPNDEAVPLDPGPSSGPIVPLALAGVVAALVPISVSFALERYFR